MAAVILEEDFHVCMPVNPGGKKNKRKQEVLLSSPTPTETVSPSPRTVRLEKIRAGKISRMQTLQMPPSMKGKTPPSMPPKQMTMSMIWKRNRNRNLNSDPEAMPKQMDPNPVADGGKEPEPEPESEVVQLEEELMDHNSDTISLEDPMDMESRLDEEIEESASPEAELSRSKSSSGEVAEVTNVEVDKVIEDVIIRARRARVQEMILKRNRKKNDQIEEQAHSSDITPRENGGDTVTASVPGQNQSQDLTVDWKRLSSTYTCRSCPELYPMDLDKLIIHIIFHWKRPNRCTECSAYLPLEENLTEKHWKKFHPGVVPPPNSPKCLEVKACPVDCWKCGEPNCAKEFMSFSKRDQHEKEEHWFVVETPETCVIGECSMKFRSIQEVRLHMALEHTEYASMCCCYCEKSFAVDAKEPGFQYRDPELFHSHVMSEHLEHTRKIWTPLREKAAVPLFLQNCPVCGLVFKSVEKSSTLDQHIKDAHGMSMSFRCDICLQDMTYKAYWSHHQRYHSSPVVCDSCGDLVSVTELPTHLLKNHGVIMEGHEQYLQRCPEKDCEYATFVRYCFREHLLTHKEDRKYKCQICQKAFKKATKRTEHMKIHTNKESKPYQCEICGNSFAIKNYLYIHKRLSHLGRKFPSTNRKRPAIPGRKTNKRKKKTPVGEPNPGINPDSDPASAPEPTETVCEEGETGERMDNNQ